MNDLLDRLLAKAGMPYMDAADGGAGGGAGDDGGKPADDKPADDANSGGDKPAGDDKSGEGDGAGDDKPAGDDTDILAGGTGKTDDNAAKVDDASGAGDDPAPEDGKYEFKFPEGVTPNEKLLADSSKAFKELGLGSKAAQKLVDAYVGAFQQAQADAMDAHLARVGEWKATARGDKEYAEGGFAAAAATANAALQKFGTPELTKVLSETGMANHPELVRFMYRVGKAIGDDVTPSGGSDTEEPVDTVTRWYSGTTPKSKKR